MQSDCFVNHIQITNYEDSLQKTTETEIWHNSLHHGVWTKGVILRKKYITKIAKVNRIIHMLNFMIEILPFVLWECGL
jgi:hypothetical protein